MGRGDPSKTLLLLVVFVSELSFMVKSYWVVVVVAHVILVSAPDPKSLQFSGFGFSWDLDFWGLGIGNLGLTILVHLVKCVYRM